MGQSPSFKIDVKAIRNRLEWANWGAVAGLELTKRPNINLADHKVIIFAAFDADKIAFPQIFVGSTDATVPVLPVIALDDVGVNIHGSGLNQIVKSFGVLIPFGYQNRIDPAAQGGAVGDVG